ncbi:hypothetical protein [Comamonas serinivorans]|nr:hypothetical protein [Comamonas serinivorans]
MNDLTQSIPRSSRVKRWAVMAGVAVAAALGVAGQAQARDVYWNVGVGAPGVSVGFGNAPVYVAPAPVYVAPPPPVYYAPPRPVYYAPPPPRYYYGGRYYRDDRHWRGHGHGHGHHRGRGHGHR